MARFMKTTAAGTTLTKAHGQRTSALFASDDRPDCGDGARPLVPLLAPPLGPLRSFALDAHHDRVQPRGDGLRALPARRYVADVARAALGVSRRRRHSP